MSKNLISEPTRKYMNNIPASLSDVLAVYQYCCNEYYLDGAIERVAKDRGVTYNTVASHCTSGLSTPDFKVNIHKAELLIENSDLLLDQLAKKFPTHQRYFRNLIATITSSHF